MKLWREKLSAVNEKAGQSLADPENYENLFPNLKDAIATQMYLSKEFSNFLPSKVAAKTIPNSKRKPMEEMKASRGSGDLACSESL